MIGFNFFLGVLLECPFDKLTETHCSEFSEIIVVFRGDEVHDTV